MINFVKNCINIFNWIYLIFALYLCCFNCRLSHLLVQLWHTHYLSMPERILMNWWHTKQKVAFRFLLLYIWGILFTENNWFCGSKFQKLPKMVKLILFCIHSYLNLYSYIFVFWYSVTIFQLSEEKDLEVNRTEVNSKKKEKKEHLTKAQKRKLYNRFGNQQTEKPRGWDWVDVIKHLSQTGLQPKSENSWSLLFFKVILVINV